MGVEDRAGGDFWPADDLPGQYETQDVDLADLLPGRTGTNAPRQAPAAGR